jgi:hypothetical protein
MVNNSTNINRHSLKHKKGGQHHLTLEMQVMAKYMQATQGCVQPD